MGDIVTINYFLRLYYGKIEVESGVCVTLIYNVFKIYPGATVRKAPFQDMK